MLPLLYALVLKNPSSKRKSKFHWPSARSTDGKTFANGSASNKKSLNSIIQANRIYIRIYR